MNPFDLDKSGKVDSDDAKVVANKLKAAWYQDPVAVIIFCVLSFALGYIVKKMFF